MFKFGKCYKCDYFQEKDWSWGTLEQRIFGVTGHCMDKENPDFNDWARELGRGIPKTQTLFSPKWCRFRKDFKGVDKCSDKWICLHRYEDSDDCPDCRH